MTKQEFLSASLPYGLKLKSPYGFRPNYKEKTTRSGIVRLTGDMYADIENNTFREDFIHIVRPLSDLTKECVQANYNNGEPFVPIVELAKIEFGDISVIETKSKKNISGIRFVDEDSDTCVLAYHYETSSFGAHVERLEKIKNEFINVYYQIELFQHLLKWHFDLITEDCEKVYVTEDFNPYK